MDETAAEVVRRIFALCMDGRGPTEIARILTADNIPTPREYFESQGINIGARNPVIPGNWSGDAVAKILERQEYLGHTVNFRTYRKTFKNKKKLLNDPSEWKIFENTHVAIVKENIWTKVQEIRKNKRRPVRTGRTSIFSGLVFCKDCNAKLYFLARPNESQNTFNCSSYRANSKNCTAHHIREIILFNLVLKHMQLVLEYVKQYEDIFIEQVGEKSKSEQTKALAVKQREITQKSKRITELDLLFQRVYEDNFNCRISDERFLKMSADYEAEQNTLKQELEKLSAEFDKEKQSAVNTDRFIALVKSYTEIEEMSPTVLHEFIEKIVVHAPDKSSGKRKQTVEIFYNAVGIIDIPSQNEMVELLKERKQRRLSEQAKHTKTA